MTLLFLGIGLAAGILSGIFGIGGGIVIVPALIFLAKFQPQQAAGTSLAVLVLPLGALIGAATFYRAGQLNQGCGDHRIGTGGWRSIGSRVATNIDPTMLRKDLRC
jgi:uncharacterized membrane protein YfcA